MNLTKKYPEHDNRTASRVIEGEIVIITPEDCMLHVLNTVGTRLWKLADGKRNIEEIISIICDEFQVEREVAGADTLEFIEQLQEKGVLILNETPAKR